VPAEAVAVAVARALYLYPGTALAHLIVAHVVLLMHSRALAFDPVRLTYPGSDAQFRSWSGLGGLEVVHRRRARSVRAPHASMLYFPLSQAKSRHPALDKRRRIPPANAMNVLLQLFACACECQYQCQRAKTYSRAPSARLPACLEAHRATQTDEYQ